MLHLRQVRKVKPNRHTGYREDFLQVSHTIFGKVHSSKAPKLPLETSSDRKWHRMTPSLVLGQYGLIAEEVAKVYPDLVTRGATGDVEAVQYHEVIPMLLNEVQHQQRQLATQVQELAALKAQNARLRAAVVHQQEWDAALAARLERLEAAAARAVALANR